MAILPVLKVVAELLPILGNIFAIFRRRKAQKRAQKAEKALEAVIVGVDTYTKAEGTTADRVKEGVKAVIKNEAVKKEIEDYLHRAVQRLTK